MKNIYTAAKAHLDVIEKALSMNISTKEELRSSTLYHDYWFTSHDLSQSISSLNPDLIKLATSAKGWDDKDSCSEFTAYLIDTFSSIANAVKKYISGNYDHNSYITAIFRNFIFDNSGDMVITEKQEVMGKDGKIHRLKRAVTVLDETGKPVKTYYFITSLSAPISNDEDSLTYEDVLDSEAYQPEKECMNRYEDQVFNKFYSMFYSHENTLENLKLVSNHKYMAQSYIYIEDKLKEEGLDYTLEKTMELASKFNYEKMNIPEDFKKYFVDAYNDDLKRFMLHFTEEKMTEEDRIFISKHLASDFKDFGRDFHISPAKVDSIRSYNKTEIKNRFIVNFAFGLH